MYHTNARIRPFYVPSYEMIWKTDDRKLAIFDMDETLIHTLYKK
jgi:hypothetical protein